MVVGSSKFHLEENLAAAAVELPDVAEVDLAGMVRPQVVSTRGDALCAAFLSEKNSVRLQFGGTAAVVRTILAVPARVDPVLVKPSCHRAR